MNKILSNDAEGRPADGRNVGDAAIRPRPTEGRPVVIDVKTVSKSFGPLPPYKGHDIPH